MTSSSESSVAICHDYLTQRGGAERVVLTMTHALKEAPVHTALFDPESTYPEFGMVDVRPGPLDRLPMVRSNHRWSLPLMAASFGRTEISADVTVCSSSGWAHGVGVTGRKLVYCHSPARWLHRPENYLEHFGPIPRVALRVARSRLLEWDRAAMASADVVVANSNTIAQQIADVYGREAEVIAPSSPLMNPGVQSPIPTLEVAMNPEGFVLCVSRLLGYKHLDLLIEVARLLPHRQFVVIGDGPHETQLLDVTPRNIKWLGVVDDAELRWCYKHATTLLSTSEEDFGLTPLEAAAYGTPSVVPGARGYLDHVAEGVSGLFHDGSPLVCADVIEDAASRSWDHDEIVAHSRLFGSDIFMKQILNLVDELR